jgi:3',5'-cyclic-nucleotide phosphodiesterase
LTPGSGVAGQSLAQQSVIIANNISQCLFFEPSVDQQTGFVTKSILAAPLYDANANVIGCTEMLNKPGFTHWDGSILETFNVVCNFVLENSNGAQATDFEFIPRLRRLAESAIAMTRSLPLPEMLNVVLRNAAEVVGAATCLFFVLDGEDFVPVSPPGVRFSATTSALSEILVTKSDVYLAESINEPEIDAITQKKSTSLVALPVFAASSAMIGVLILQNLSRGFADGESGFIAPYLALISLAVEIDELHTEVGRGLATYFRQAERRRCEIPEAFELTQAEQATVSSLECFSLDFRGVGHYKELFFFFSTLNFLTTFNITGEQFFRFLCEVSQRYTTTSYHNWSHACDVTQCIFFMITKGKVTEQYEAWEVFTLLTAAICHDTNHRGLNNVFNLKAETPLGILYKDQSVMEMWHIGASIPILCQRNIDLFSGFDPTERKKVWNLFIAIILATDMAKHFALVKTATAALDEGNFDFTNPELRLLGLQMLIKVADISNVSRPFAMADKWCDILNVEFFHQGDLEKEESFGLTSPLNDRTTSDKPKSQIGFYSFICVPLYTVLARLYPLLDVMLESVKSNLARWKELQAAAAPPT